MSDSYTPVNQDILDKIAELGNLDAVYDTTVSRLPRQPETVVLMAVKVVDGNAFAVSHRVFTTCLDPRGLDSVVANLAQLTTVSAGFSLASWEGVG